MFALILLVIFGSVMAYFATQNVSGVSISLANQTLRGIPLYIVVIAAMLLGIFASWLISLVNGISSTMTIRGKDSALRDTQRMIRDLKRDNHDLELENARLKGEQHPAHTRPSLFQRIQHRFS